MEEIREPRCRVCASNEAREAIEEAIGAREADREIARRFGISRDSVRRHRERHMAAPEVGRAAEPEPAAAPSDAPAEPEVWVVARPFRRHMDAVLVDLREGTIIVAGATLEKLKAVDCPLRPPTEAELRRFRGELRMREVHAPAPPPPPPPIPEPLPIPRLDEAELAVLRDPQALARAQEGAADEMRATARAGAPPGLIAATYHDWRYRFGQAASPGAKLIVAHECANYYIEMRGQNLVAMALDEQNQRQHAASAAAATAGFDPRQWLRAVAARGISITAQDGRLLIRPRGSLNSVDLRLIDAHREVIVRACSDAEVL